jgi:hypothetical protein
MYKLAFQALVSLAVSLGVAIGVSPDVRGEVRETWQEGRALVHELTSGVYTASHVGASTEVNAAIAADNSDEAQLNADTQVSAETNVQTVLDGLFGDANAEGSAGAHAQSGASVETEDGGLDLFTWLGSSLNFGLGE